MPAFFNDFCCERNIGRNHQVAGFETFYDLVIGEVERPLFKAVMDYTDGNQSQAAGILGINRGTLRKKLRSYSLIH